MSYPAWFEDLLAQIDSAREKVIYGPGASSAVVMAAEYIEGLRQNDDPGAKKLLEMICAQALLESREHLKGVVAALEKRGHPNALCQLKVLDAYEAAAMQRGCEEPEPTLGEIRDEFLRKHDKSLLPRGFTLRKMVLKTFGLPLSKAKRGRPRGSRSEIGNPKAGTSCV